MGKLNVNVGDEVYLKVKIVEISEMTHNEDYYITVAYPDWFNGPRLDRKVHVTWSQHLLFAPDGKEA